MKVPLKEIHEGCKWSLVKQRCNITAAVCHAKNQHVRILQTIYYDVLAYRETPRANAKVVVARAAQVGMACKKEKSVGDGIDQAIGDFKVTALFGDVIPDIVQVGGGLRRYAVRHQRDAGRSLARRAWPRCFTSSASSRIDCCVMVRPSPRAREALASSRVAKNSARLRSRFFPQRQRFVHRFFYTVKPARLDGLADKRFLVGGQMYFHILRVRVKKAGVKRSFRGCFIKSC